MKVQLPNGSVAEFPDDMPQDQVESALSQLDPQAVPDTQGISESQFQPQQQFPVQTDENSPSWMTAGGTLTNPNQEQAKIQNPGFMKTLDMLNTGVHRGVTNFTLGVMSILPFGKSYQKAIKDYDASIEAEQQKNIGKYSSLAPQIGELGGELIATSPAGGLLGKIGSKAIGLAAGEAVAPSLGLTGALPVGTRLLGAYGTAGAAGATVLGGTEALRYQGDQFDPSKAVETFTETMSNPLAYAAPIVGTAVGRYLNKAKALAGQGVDLLPRDVMERGPAKKLYNAIFDSVQMMSPISRRAAQLENIGDSVENIIRGFTGMEGKVNADKLVDYASKNLQMGLKKLDAKGNILWEQGGFKSAPVQNMDEISPLLEQAKQLYQETGATNYTRFNKRIDYKSMGKNLSFGDIKEIGTVLGDAAHDAFKSGKALDAEVGTKLSQIRKEILEKASGNLNDDQLKAFKAAQTFTKSQYELQEAVPLVKEAINSELEARKVVQGILKDSLEFDKTAAMNIMSPKGQAVTKGAAIAQALADSTDDAGVNLNKLLKKLAPEYTSSNVEKVLGKEYEPIAGLAKHLSAINEARRIGQSTKITAAVLGSGAVAGLGASGNLNMENINAVAPYAAMLLAANHPVLKRLLGAGTKKLSPSTYNLINSKIQDIFTRAGFLYNEDGSMSKQEKK